MADTKISDMPSVGSSTISNELDYISFPLVQEVGGNFANKRTTARDLKEVFKPDNPAFLMAAMEGNVAVGWAGALFNSWSGSSVTLMYSSIASWSGPVAGEIGYHASLFQTGTWRITITSRLRFNDGTSSSATPMELPNGIFEYGWQISNQMEVGALKLHPANAFSSRHTRSGRSISAGSERTRQLTWTDTFYVDYDGDESVNYARIEPSFYLDLDPAAVIAPGSFPWISAVITAEKLITDSFPN